MISDAAFVFVVLNGTYVPAGLLRSDGRSGFFFASVADVERILEDMCEIVENWEERFVQCGVKEQDLDRLQSRFTLHQECSSGPSPW